MLVRLFSRANAIHLKSCRKLKQCFQQVMGDYRDDIIETGSINLVKGWESGERPVTDSIRCHFSNYEAVNG